MHHRPLVTVIIDFNCRGAGQEVGRSCIMLEFKNKKIMVSNLGESDITEV